MTRPVDTSKLPPEVHLAAGLIQGGPESIEASEAEGQAQMVQSDVIPAKGYKAEELLALGFEVGAVDEKDPLFRNCKLPTGWSKEPSDHSMWSYIVDEHGFRRIAIFYKAAFYDRRAELHIEPTPCTKAQVDARTAFEEKHRYLHWSCDTRIEGDVLVVEAHEQVVGEGNRPVFDEEHRDAKRTGKTEIRRFAPDGTQVDA